MIDMKTMEKRLIPVVLAILLIWLDINFFFRTKFFFPGIIISLLIAYFPVMIAFFFENRRRKELESNFPEFTRDLAGAIKSGMSVSKAVESLGNKEYGLLTPYVKRLAYQVQWGMSVRKAMISFSQAVKNRIIERAVATIIEAEKAGGSLADVLEGITNSVIEIQELKERRTAQMRGQLIQSYVIFFVFIIVMLVIHRTFIMGINTEGITIILEGGTLLRQVTIQTANPAVFFASLLEWLKSFNGVLISISVIQGAFSGLTIGKLIEGSIRYGVKHSLILAISAFFILSFTL